MKDPRGDPTEPCAQVHSQNRFAVIPTPLRMRADAERTGRGVTIAFLNSGFYPHPELKPPINQIISDGAQGTVTAQRLSLQARD